jgi:peroxiredoxin
LLIGRASLLTTVFLAVAAAARAQSEPFPAPHFSVKTFDGKVVKLAELRGKPVVVDFWATWCRPCRVNMPHLDQVQKRFEERGLVVIGLSVDETGPAEVKRFAHGLGVRFRLAMANDRVLDHYGPIRFLPTTFFINRNGEVIRRVRGYIDAETLEAYVLELF